MSFNLLPDKGTKSSLSNFKIKRFENPKRKDNRLDATQRGYKHNPILYLFKSVLRRDRICKICNYRLACVVDHILSKGIGGTDTLENLQGLCKRCHDIKTTLCDGGMGRPRVAYDDTMRLEIAHRSLHNSRPVQ